MKTLGAFAAVIVASVMLSAGGHALAANLVQNPDFDLNTPAAGTAPMDWTLFNAPSGSDFFVGPGPTFGAFSPPNSANFGATGSFDDILTQDLATTPGRDYVVSFWLAHDSSNNSNDFSVRFGSSTIFTLTNVSSFPYTLFTITAPATSSTTTLAFLGREVPAWYDLDNVSVTAVPEPGTWALMLLGIGLIGAALRGYGRLNKELDALKS